MHLALTGILAFLALGWIALLVDVARGVPSIPLLRDVAPLADGDCPSVSVLFAARDEAEKLPRALETFLALDYPRYEVVAANDRSVDETEAILESAARNNALLKLVRLNSLPAGWLGKPHALEQAFERSTGEWLVFTDADVHFAPLLLRRAMGLAVERGWDHLTLLSSVEMHTLGEKIALTFFGMGFLLGIRPWRVSHRESHFYAGVGAFQLIRRSAYEAIGTHRRLAMEVVDDMKLGKLVKQGGFRSGVARGFDSVRVRWHSGVGNLVRGTTKNFFAAAEFSLPFAILQLFMLFMAFVFPFAALPIARGWALGLAAISAGIVVMIQAGVCVETGVSPIYALTAPIGALIFCWMLARSTIVTLWNGGIEWRGTFYPLEELRRGLV
ncbi:MAG: glycosyltransferase [Candidatus Acidiferrales bacterium]